MTEKPDRKLAAITEALQVIPLEERVPGYGRGGLSAWGKAGLLALLDDGETDWDSEDSSRYHDGCEQGEADGRTGGELAPAMRDEMPRLWLEGYEDGRASVTAEED
jgi:hypothetical protein